MLDLFVKVKFKICPKKSTTVDTKQLQKLDSR